MLCISIAVLVALAPVRPQGAAIETSSVGSHEGGPLGSLARGNSDREPTVFCLLDGEF